MSDTKRIGRPPTPAPEAGVGMNHDLTITIRDKGTALGVCSCGETTEVVYDPSKPLAGYHAMGRAERRMLDHWREVDA